MTCIYPSLPRDPHELRQPPFLPGGRPYRAFDPYALAADRHFAAVDFGGLLAGEVRRAGAEAESFSAIGTLAVIREFDVPQAGLMQIECVGTQRFRVRPRSGRSARKPSRKPRILRFGL